MTIDNILVIAKKIIDVLLVWAILFYILNVRALFHLCSNIKW